MELNDSLTLLRTGAAGSEPRKLANGAPFLVVPDGYSIESLEFLLNNPLKRRASLEFYDVADLLSYAHTYREVTSIVMWYMVKKGEYKIIVILDYHEAGLGQDLARSWSHQVFMKLTSKVDVSKAVKQLKDKSKMSVFNCYAQVGPWGPPVTQPEKK
jgi:hypothetical protein